MGPEDWSPIREPDRAPVLFKASDSEAIFFEKEEGGNLASKSPLKGASRTPSCRTASTFCFCNLDVANKCCKGKYPAQLCLHYGVWCVRVRSPRSWSMSMQVQKFQQVESLTCGV